MSNALRNAATRILQTLLAALPELLELAGASALVTAAFLFHLIAGVLALGVCLLIAGYAADLARVPADPSAPADLPAEETR